MHGHDDLGAEQMETENSTFIMVWQDNLANKTYGGVDIVWTGPCPMPCAEKTNAYSLA